MDFEKHETIKSYAGHDWLGWRVKARAYARLKGYPQPTLEDRPAAAREGEAADAFAARQREWDRQNNMLFSFLALKTEGAAAAIVGQSEATENGRAAWLALEAQHQQEGLQARVITRQRLNEFKFAEGANIDDGILLLERLWRSLVVQGEDEEEDTMKAVTLLSKLPSSYTVLTSMLSTNPGLSYANAKAAVKAFYIRQRKAGDGQEPARDGASGGAPGMALVASGRGPGQARGGGRGRGSRPDKPIKCHRCGEAGHFIRDCHHKEGWCHVCGSREHGAHECHRRARAPADDSESRPKRSVGHLHVAL